MTLDELDSNIHSHYKRLKHKLASHSSGLSDFDDKPGASTFN